MSGFAQVPLTVAADRRLSLGARHTYTILTFHAWKGGRARGDATHGVAMPPQPEIADQVGCSVSSLNNYLAELKRNRYVATVKNGPRASLYHLFDQPATDAELKALKPQKVSSQVEDKSGLPLQPVGELGLQPVGGQGDALPYRGLDLKAEASANALALTATPPEAKVAGRNLPMDAIIEVCGIDPASRHRFTAIQKCLTGGSANPGAGIRDLFWIECVRFAEQHDRVADLQAITPEGFAELLARRIHLKADVYRKVMPEGTGLTPEALHKWWLDIENRKERADVPLTYEEVRRIVGD